jgi:YesN/AraC family two-component response regulator
VSFLLTDTDEALRIARTQDIDPLLTDVQMGSGMNGIELAERLNEEKPGIKTFVISGFPESETLVAENGLPYLSKPLLP